MNILHRTYDGWHKVVLLTPLSYFLPFLELGSISYSDVVQLVGHIHQPVAYLVGRLSHGSINTNVLAFEAFCVIIHSYAVQYIVALHESPKTVDAVVQVVFDLVEVTVVIVSNRFRNFTTADTFNIFSRNIQRANECIKSNIYFFEN
jgi:hypothetical protein